MRGFWRGGAVRWRARGSRPPFSSCVTLGTCDLGGWSQHASRAVHTVYSVSSTPLFFGLRFTTLPVRYCSQRANVVERYELNASRSWRHSGHLLDLAWGYSDFAIGLRTLAKQITVLHQPPCGQQRTAPRRCRSAHTQGRGSSSAPEAIAPPDLQRSRSAPLVQR